MRALLMIDWQKGFEDAEHWGGERNNPSAAENARKLLALWRERGHPVYWARHDSSEPNSPLHPEHPGNDFMDGLEPHDGEYVCGKSVNSAFIGTTLEADLRKAGITALTICGISTEHCVSTTTRMAGNLGFDVTLVEDACFAWCHGGFDAETIHRTQLAVLDGEFAAIVKTADLMKRI